MPSFIASILTFTAKSEPPVIFYDPASAKMCGSGSDFTTMLTGKKKIDEYMFANGKKIRWLYFKYDNIQANKQTG